MRAEKHTKSTLFLGEFIGAGSVERVLSKGAHDSTGTLDWGVSWPISSIRTP